MPTVHLSLPESIYRELKEKAGELGIQVTDLIKLFIRLGLEHGLSRTGVVDAEAVNALSRKLDRLERDFRVKTTILEGKYRQLEETLNYLVERLEMIEELVSASVKREPLREL